MAVSVKFKKPNKRNLITVAAFAAAIIIAAVLLNFAGNRLNFFDTNRKYIQGIDVSQHNGEIEWEKAANDAEFAIIRAGFRGYGSGEINKDSRFEENAKGANNAGIPIGVYFYTQATTPEEAEEEAEFVIDLIKPYDIDFPVFIDFEYPHDSDGQYTGRLNNAMLSGSEAAELINAFCDRIKQAGYKAGVYSSSSLLNFNIKTSALDKGLFIWVADYNSKVTYLGKYDMWQYSKTGSCKGVNSKHTDLNRWYTDR